VPADTVRRIRNVFYEEVSLTGAFGSYDDAPAEPNFLSQYKNLFHHYHHQTAKREAFTFWAGCGAIRRDVFIENGGFSKKNRLEDVELGYRLIKDGHKIILLKTLQVKHLKRWTVYSLIRADFLFRALPWSRLILQKGRFENDLNIQIHHRISVALAILLLPSFAGIAQSARFAGIPIAIMAGLLGLHLDLYRYFMKKRGLLFAMKTIPWHWLYYIYSGLAFFSAFVMHLFEKPTETKASTLKQTGSEMGRRR